MGTYIVEVYKKIAAPLEAVQESDFSEHSIGKDILIQAAFKEEIDGHWEATAAYYTAVEADDVDSAQDTAMKSIDFASLDEVINSETVWSAQDGDWTFWEATPK